MIVLAVLVFVHKHPKKKEHGKHNGPNAYGGRAPLCTDAAMVVVVVLLEQWVLIVQVLQRKHNRYVMPHEKCC